MKKLIFCVGISGSGKSTWAKKQSNSIIIERDEIREELFPGYWKQKPDDKKEKQVTSLQKKRIKEAFKSDKTQIIISDTNLKVSSINSILGYIDGLEKDYQYETKTFFDSYNLERCITRNRNREKIVPEEVICKQWFKFIKLGAYQEIKNKYSFYSNLKPIVVIPDLHGQWSKFKKIVADYKGYTLISLGDLNDTRVNTYGDLGISSLSLLEYFYNHKDSDLVHLVHSNHQKNLIRLCRGKRENLSYGLLQTVNELYDLGELSLRIKDGDKAIKESVKPSDKLLNICNFLDTRPACIRLVHKGQEWRLAHGFVSRSQKDFDPYPSNRDQYIYSPKSTREWWFEREQEASSFKALCGHNHAIFVGNNSVILDHPKEDIIRIAIFEQNKEVYFRDY